MEVSPARIYLSDKQWSTGYYTIPWTSPVSAGPKTPEYEESQGYRMIKWPLPQNRCYEIAPLDNTPVVLLRASAFVADTTPEWEGETL